MKNLLTGRLASLLSWPIGVLLTSWFYVWRTTPIHRRERSGAADGDLPPPAPSELSSDEEVQQLRDGAGPLFRRRYRGRVAGGKESARELMQRIQRDPNLVAPLALARFSKVSGSPERLAPGDQFVVRMPGPWDGPVRAVEVTPTSFRFVTLRRHLEAGQIEWRAREEDGVLVFEIESWARAGDRFSALLHDHLRMAKEVQLHMWTSVIEKVASVAGGKLEGGIDIDTRRVDADELP